MKNLSLLLFFIAIGFSYSSANASLNLKNMVGLELIFAHPKSKQNSSSIPSELMLRIVDSNNDVFDDQVIQFQEKYPEGQLSKMKFLRMLMLGNPLKMNVSDMSEVLRFYMVAEKFSFKRLVLPMSKEQIKTFKESLLFYQKYPDYFGKYDRNSNNNLLNIMRVLSWSGFYASAKDVVDDTYILDPSSLSPLMEPKDLIKYLINRAQTHMPALNVVYSESGMPNFVTVPQALYSTDITKAKIVYNSFLKNNFSQKRIQNLKQRVQKIYTELKRKYSTDKLINSKRKYPRRLTFDQKNFKYNTKLVLEYK